VTRTVFHKTVDLKEAGKDPVIEIPGGGHFLMLKDREYSAGGFLIDPNKPKFDTWWAVDTDNPVVEVQLHIRGTGEEVPPSVTYLGTIFPMPGLHLHVWQKDRLFEDMHIVDGKFVPKSQ
jgi:hypothetical protein